MTDRIALIYAATAEPEPGDSGQADEALRRIQQGR